MRRMPDWRELEDLPTLQQGYTCDLKVDTGELRLWQARTTIEDGEPFRHTIYIERLQMDGRWADDGCYDGSNPPLLVGDWSAFYDEPTGGDAA